MGGDDIPPMILKHAASALAEPVHHLFSLCLTKSYLPAEWRCHHITPIHKSGDRSTITNYHPISLLSCLFKILERLVFDKTYDFIVKTSISNSQFGFVRNRSTLHQLLLYSEFLHNAYDNRQQVDSIYLDIRKALTQSLMRNFYPNYGMLASLVTSGVSSKPIYPTDNINVLLLPTTSQIGTQLLLVCRRRVASSAPYFIFFINDLTLIPSFSTPYFFADDTKCCTKILSLSDSSCLQDLNLINSWSSHSGLTFNISKSCLLRFYNRSTSTIDATYHLGQSDIPSLDRCKDLGIVFSADLSWSHHYNHIL